MIGLIGRHPANQPALLARAELAKSSEAAVKALISTVSALSSPMLEEVNFPNFWGVFKHHFLYAQYGGKCAYCETRTAAGYPGDVEHFRPKAYCQDALTPPSNLNDVAGAAPGRKMGPKGPGYWWLAYDWWNYLYSCNRCNSIWKKNQFPVSGKRAQLISKLESEIPLLINPFEIDPAGDFDFDAITGQIVGLTPAAIKTVEVCGLNRRSLDVDRQVKGAKLNRRYREYVNALAANNLQAQNNALSALLDECRCKEAYAAMARVFVKKKVGIDYLTLLQMKRRRQL